VKNQVVLLGLPSTGLDLLAYQLDVRYCEIPEIREAWDGLPDIETSLSETWVSSQLAQGIGDARRRAVLLVYTSPATFLAHRLKRAVETRLAPEDLESYATASLDFWRAYHRALLEQYREHEDRALLLSGDHGIDFEALLSQMKELSGSHDILRHTPKSVPEVARASMPSGTLLQIVDAYSPECLELYAELESCAGLMGREPEFGVIGPEDRAAQAREILDVLAVQNRLALVLARFGMNLDDCESQLDNLEKQVRQANEGAEQNLKKLSEQQSQVSALLEQCALLGGRASTTEAERDSLVEEKERLLSQLQRSQEQLEHMSSLRRKNDEEVEAATAQIAKDRDRIKQLLEQLSAKDSDNVAEIGVMQGEKELLQLQLNQLQEELEHYYSLKLETAQSSMKGIEKFEEVAKSPQQEPGRNGVDLEEKSGFSLFGAAGALLTLTSRRNWILRGHTRYLRESGFFDEKWYLKEYPDVAKSGLDPVEHYLRVGVSEGKNPSPNFDTRWYLQCYPDVAAAKMNPLLHYVKFGRHEGREPKRFRA